ncbi:MAG: hypothetical protein QOC94_2276 [Actinoplanes sp.]|jgi:hypothetical protein|nr:hypothetical protein [Actinoplanes sp.]
MNCADAPGDRRAMTYDMEVYPTGRKTRAVGTGAPRTR